MPQEQQQFQGGTFTPISGLVEHTAKPLEAFNQVGDALQQRYWQAKQQYDVLDQTIKNMPMFDKTVDQQHIDVVNKKISDTINPIIQNDDFHKAQGTVMDLTKEVSNDKGLKAISRNVALWQAQTTEFEKRYEKEPQLRQAEARREAYAKVKYREQGGALDVNGNYQQVPIWTPTTNLDISEETKRVQDLAIKLKDFANERTSIGMNAMNGDPTNAFAGDPDMQKAMTLLTKTTTNITSLTKERIEELARETVNADPQYKIKLREIAQVNLFNNEHKLEADAGSIYNVISSDKSIATKQLALSMSPTYNAEIATLQHNYNTILQSGDHKSITAAKQIYNNAVKKLSNNASIIKEGSDKVSALEPSQLNELYVGMQAEKLNQQVIHSGDQFAFQKVKSDMDIVPTHLYEAHVRQLDKTNKMPILAAMDNGTLPLESGLKYMDPLSESDKSFGILQGQYNAAKNTMTKVPPSLELAYKSSLANRNGIISALGDNYDNASTDIKHNIENDWRSVLGMNTTLHTRDYSIKGPIKDIFAQSDFDVNDVKTNRSSWDKIITAMKDPTVASNIKVTNMTKFILNSVPKSELLHSNTRDLVMKYGLPVTMVTTDFNQVLQGIDKAKYAFSTRIAKYTANTNKFDTPQTELTSYGTDTPETLNMRTNVMRQFFSGNFTDTSGKLWTADELKKANIGYKTIDPKNLNNSDMNDNSETQVSMINHHGAYLDNDQLVKIVVPKFKTLDTGAKIPDGFQEIKGFFRGGKAIANSAILTNMNKIKTILMNPKTDATTMNLAIQYGKESANNLGGGLTDETGTNIYAKLNSFQQSNWNVNGVKHIGVVDATGTTSNYSIKKVATGYEVVRPKDGITFNIANVKDFVTIMGLNQSRDNGLDASTYELLVKDVIQRK